jgi:hypothetical protein
MPKGELIALMRQRMVGGPRPITQKTSRRAMARA